MGRSLSALFIYALLLLLLCVSSAGVLGTGLRCGLSSIQVHQHTTGAREGLDMEFEVEIKNACACAQGNVRLRALGFASQKPVNPGVFRRDGGAFLVNGGNPIPAGSTVKFSYWWDHRTALFPGGSRAICNDS